MPHVPGGLQLSLVSHYGAKPPELAALVRRCQAPLAANLGAGFAPYALDQVHATLIGLEGRREAGRIVNRNAAELGAPSFMEPADLLCFLREDFAPIEVQIGGFRPGRDYGFESRGGHPSERCFSIQGGIAVAMGWPVRDGAYPNSIDELRWTLCRRFGVRHKWHRDEGARDNDLYFVLGRVVDGGPDRSALDRATREVREYLSGRDGLRLRIGRDTLRVVAYDDPSLPPETSRAWALDDPELTPERLRALYPAPE